MPTPQEMVTNINAAGAVAKAEQAELAADRAAARAASKPSVSGNAPESKYPEFLSTTGRPIQVALLSGHITSVSADPENPTRLHPRFHRRAVELGAMPASVAKQMQAEMDASAEEAAAVGRDEIILKNIGQMVSQADINPSLQSTLFTKDGRPDCESLTQRCGFLVRSPERDRLWETYQGELA